MTTILFCWTVIAAGSGTSYSMKWESHDWRNFGEFKSIKSCEEAAKTLGYDEVHHRCVSK